MSVASFCLTAYSSFIVHCRWTLFVLGVGFLFFNFSRLPKKKNWVGGWRKRRAESDIEYGWGSCPSNKKSPAGWTRMDGKYCAIVQARALISEGSWGLDGGGEGGGERINLFQLWRSDRNLACILCAAGACSVRRCGGGGGWVDRKTHKYEYYLCLCEVVSPSIETFFQEWKDH